MKRRAFISKTALAAAAAPLLPTALVKASAVPVVVDITLRWLCEAKSGLAVARLATDDLHLVVEFVKDHPTEELTIHLDGSLLFARIPGMIPVIV